MVKLHWKLFMELRYNDSAAEVIFYNRFKCTIYEKCSWWQKGCHILTKWLITVHMFMSCMLFVIIADVAVRKPHPRLDEIRIIFTRTSSKTCFQKTLSCNIHPRHLTQFSSHSICWRACYKYTHFTQHTLGRNAYVTDRKTTLLIQVQCG